MKTIYEEDLRVALRLIQDEVLNQFIFGVNSPAMIYRINDAVEAYKRKKHLETRNDVWAVKMVVTSDPNQVNAILLTFDLEDATLVPRYPVK